MSAILKIFKPCLLQPSWKLDGAETWRKASGQHGDLELLKWFCSDVQDGYHGSHLENLQITSATERKVWLSLNMGGIGVLWKFRIAKILLFQCPRWPPSWNASNHFSSQTVSQVELMGGIGVTWRFRIAESYSSNIQDGSHGGNLETFQTTSDS